MQLINLVCLTSLRLPPLRLITFQAVALCALGVTVAHPSRHNHARLHDREVTSQPMHVHPQHNHSGIVTTPLTLTPPASTPAPASTSIKRKHHTRSHVNSHSPKRNATTIVHEHTTVKHAKPTALHNGTTTHAHHHHHEHHIHQHHNATTSHSHAIASPLHNVLLPRAPSDNILIKSHTSSQPLTTTLIISNKHTPTPKGKPQSSTTIVITPVSSSSTTPVTTSAPAGTSLQSLYGQCYGSYYTGPTACVAGATCQINGPWWGQCASATGSSATPTFSSSSASSAMPVITSSTSVVVSTSVASTTKPSSGVSSKTKTTKSKTTKTKTKAAASQTVSMMIAAPVKPAGADETMTIGL